MYFFSFMYHNVLLCSVLRRTTEYRTVLYVIQFSTALPCPVLVIYRPQVAIALDSATLAMDAMCSLGCIKLSVVLFCGSVLFLIDDSLWCVALCASLFS
jgi:hypothetical protein